MWDEHPVYVIDKFTLGGEREHHAVGVVRTH